MWDTINSINSRFLHLDLEPAGSAFPYSIVPLVSFANPQSALLTSVINAVELFWFAIVNMMVQTSVLFALAVITFAVMAGADPVDRAFFIPGYH